MSRDRIKTDNKLWDFSHISMKSEEVFKDFIVLKKYGDNDALLVNIANGEVSLQTGVYKYQVFNLDDEGNITSSELIWMADKCLATWNDISEVEFDKAKSLIDEKNVGLKTDNIININRRKNSR